MNLYLLGYLVVFGGAALGSFAGIVPTREIQHSDTRRGLIGLLGLSGLWASAHVGFLTAPTTGLKIAFYEVGLVAGLAAVGAWLYFCSAYTGRSLHRNTTLRRLAIAVFLLLILLKVTNPVHQLYFTTEFTTQPFVHLSVRNGPIHWFAMALAYALATVGYFMLFELFVQVSYNTRPLAVLVGITGLPVVLDVIGYASPLLIDITYEPLGVAVFAVVTLGVYLDRFQSIRVAGVSDDPVIVLDEGGRLRDFNHRARTLFPELTGDDAVGSSLDSVLPELASTVESDRQLFERDFGNSTRTYRVASNPFTADSSRLGEVLTLSDVSEREAYRQELERQNERLAEFANTVSHDLRNPLTVATGRLEIAESEFESEDLRAAGEALDRMDAIIEDVLALARQGRPPEDEETVSLGSIAEAAWDMVETTDVELRLEDDVRFEADPSRLQQLFENLFRNAVEHGRPVSDEESADAVDHASNGGRITVTVGAIDGSGFFVADDGRGIAETDRDAVFDSGYTTDESGTGLGLSIVREIAEAHGWDIAVTESATGGTRFEITGVNRP